jgi:hypothetical protein
LNLQEPTPTQIKNWWDAMSKPLPEYQQVVEALIPVLYNLPAKIVAIDGLNGTGKTTLGRFLAHKFNCTLIETDLFMVRPALDYRFEEMKKIVNGRLERQRPIFIEGVAVLRTLETMNHKPHFHIYWENVDPNDLGIDRGDELGSELKNYNQEYSPSSKANLNVKAIVRF